MKQGNLRTLSLSSCVYLHKKLINYSTWSHQKRWIPESSWMHHNENVWVTSSQMSQPDKEISVEFRSLCASTCSQGVLCQHYKAAEFQRPLIWHSKEYQQDQSHPLLPESAKEKCSSQIPYKSIQIAHKLDLLSNRTFYNPYLINDFWFTKQAVSRLSFANKNFLNI